jgi:hypothetical protein
VVGHGLTISAEWGTTGSGIGGWRPDSNVVAGFVNTPFGVVHKAGITLYECLCCCMSNGHPVSIRHLQLRICIRDIYVS